MIDIIVMVIVAIVALIAGIVIGRVLLKKAYKQEEDKAREQAEMIVKEAELKGEAIKKDKILEAKEKFLKLKSEFEEEANKKKNQIISNENNRRMK
jgi:ribonuclease Y